MNQQQLIQRVRSGEDVVLREPHVAFFARTLGPILLVLVSGIGLALVKGGLWWSLPLAGGIATLVVLLWVPFRKVPQLQITRQGITYQNRFFEWVQIETFSQMKDVVLTNGQTLYDAFTDLQKRTSWKAQLGKYFLFSTILAPVGSIAGVLVPFGNAPALLGFLGGGVGLLVGIVISMIMYRPLRKRGYLW